MQEGQYNSVEMSVENGSAAPSTNEKEQQRNIDQTLKPLAIGEPAPSVQKESPGTIVKNLASQNQRPSIVLKENTRCGKEVSNIETNYLKINVDKVAERVYRYDVNIQMSAPKTLHTKVFSHFCAKFLQSKQIALDTNNMIALSPCELNIRNEIYRRFDFELPNTENDWKMSTKCSTKKKLNKKWDCKVTMKPAKKITIPIRQVLTGNIKDAKHRNDTIYALDVIFNSAYHQPHLNHGIQDKHSIYLKMNDDLPYLKEHYELRSGLYQRIVSGEKDGQIRPMLNVDAKHRAFPKPYTNLVDLLHAIAKEQRLKIDLTKQLNSKAMKSLISHLEGLEICYKFDETDNGVLKFLELGNKPRYEIKSSRNGIKKMVEQYCDEHGLRIKNPHLQCLRLGSQDRNISVPIEFCSIVGDQIVYKTFSKIQAHEMKTHTTLDPIERKELIMHHLQEINHNRCDSIRAFGLSVEEKFMRVHARMIQPPTIEYSDRKSIKPKNGEWPMNYGCDIMEVLNSPVIPFTWCILNTDANVPEIKLKQFAKMIYRKSQMHGIRMNEQPNEIVFAKFDDIKEKLKKMAEDEIKIIICIIPNSDLEYYEIKLTADLELDITTQCIKYDTISNGTEYRETFILHINAKLNGENQKLSTAPILRDFDKEPVMLVGARITTPTEPGQRKAPSVDGMVASFDKNAFRYHTDSSSGGEIDFKSNFLRNLKLFREKNALLPKKVIYFRDDECRSSSNFAVALERDAMLEACREVDEGYEKIVRITIVIVEKERGVCLFARSNAENDAEITNVSPGTIVEPFFNTHHPKQFYMVSQQAVEGVSRPTKYRIWMDQGDHCIYDLQELIYFLCHMFARCNRSVSFPAPVHHARLVADRSKLYLTNSNGGVATDNLDTNSHRPVRISESNGMYAL